MLQIVTLSASAVATLRFVLKGPKKTAREIDLSAYRELVAAGIMDEQRDGTQLTEEGRADGEEIVDRESERIEGERYVPPDVSRLSAEAWGLLRRIATAEPVEVTAENRPLFRELADARVALLINSFAGGQDSAWRWTYWGWKRKADRVETACAKRAV